MQVCYDCAVLTMALTVEIPRPLEVQRGEVLLGEPVHPPQVDVRILLPLELLAAHMAAPVHVPLHVSVKLVP